MLGLELLYLFKHVELTKFLGQSDKVFVDLLNKVLVGNINDAESHENIQKMLVPVRCE